MKNIFLIFVFFSGCLLLWGCSKQDEFLNKKYNLTDVIPETVEDFQALLDNDQKLNYFYPASGLIGTDNYYVPDDYFALLQPYEREGYLWIRDALNEGVAGDWRGSYTPVSYANLVLEGLEKIKPPISGTVKYNQVKGSALFFRSFAFYQLTQSFAKPYSATATSDPGIVLRLSSDVKAPITRATLAQTYEKIIADLNQAAELLPNLPSAITRPSKLSAYSLLAKAYLNMSQYAKAEEFSMKALTLYSALLDFNTVPTGNLFGFGDYYQNNPEFIFYALNNTFPMFDIFSSTYVDTVLVNSYEPTDLRPALFFSDNPGPPTGKFFVGSYGVGIQFGGIGTNEIYLIKAEAQVRQNKVAEGLTTLNQLLIKRYAAPFIPKTAANQQAALLLVLQERRKELPFTSQIRWEDIRRLNLDPALAVTLTRKVNGATYTLPPNDKRYVLLIPEKEIRLSGIQQNP